MKSNFNVYAFAKKTLIYLLLLIVVAFSFYYSYGAVIDIFFLDQNQNQAQDPLENDGSEIGSSESIDSPSLMQAQSQSAVSDEQRQKELKSIKTNQSITDAKKQQIMEELAGGRR